MSIAQHSYHISIEECKSGVILNFSEARQMITDDGTKRTTRNKRINTSNKINTSPKSCQNVNQNAPNIEPNNEFVFNDFLLDNIPLKIRENTAMQHEMMQSILRSNILRFALEKDCSSLQILIDKISKEKMLLENIFSNESTIDNNYLQMIAVQLSEYSLSLSSQSLVIDISCDILHQFEYCPDHAKSNKFRRQCIGYQSKILDIHTISPHYESKYFDIWGKCYNSTNFLPALNKMDTETSYIVIVGYIRKYAAKYAPFLSDIIKICYQFFYISHNDNAIFNIKTMKQNYISDAKPRTLYIDILNKTLTIHDPTDRGRRKQKVDTVITEDLVISFNYTVSITEQSKQMPDIVTICYYKTKTDKQKKRKKNFNYLINEYEGRRFVSLMKTFIAPSKIPSQLKLGSGPFIVDKQLAKKLRDSKLSMDIILHLLQQKYVELSLIEKWCWYIKDSSVWMTDSSLTGFRNLKMSKKKKMRKLIDAFSIFLHFHGFDLVSVSCTSKQLIPPIIWALLPSLAEYLHDCWLESLRKGGWSFDLNHSFQHKCSPWFVDWKELPPTGKNVRIQQAMILIKCVSIVGLCFKSRKLS